MRDEARLVFLCGGPRATDSEIAVLASRALDWGLVTQLATAARAVPVVASRIGAALGAGLPGPALHLSRLAMVEEFELQRMEERLEETVHAFGAAGVPAILLKGAALARTVFRSLADRPMLDLDVMVPVEHVSLAREVALAAGWLWRHDRRYAPFFATHHHLPPLVDGRGTRALLELHTGLFPHGHPFLLESDHIISRAKRVERGGTGYLVPSSEDHLVYLCGHWVWSHMMNGGAWRALRDVGALTARGGLDWELATTRAHSARATTCVYWTLRLAHVMTGAVVPATVLAALEPPTPEVLLNRLERYFIWQLAGGPPCPSVRLSQMLWAAALRPGWSAHGLSRPWKNPEMTIWTHEGARGARGRLAGSLGFAVELARI